jgi:hypothetical protein
VGDTAERESRGAHSRFGTDPPSRAVWSVMQVIHRLRFRGIVEKVVCPPARRISSKEPASQLIGGTGPRTDSRPMPKEWKRANESQMSRAGRCSARVRRVGYRRVSQPASRS